MKYPTLVSRLQENCVKRANLFFRTSPAARAAPRTLVDTRIAPPWGYSAIVSTFLSMPEYIEVEFAEGEADPHIVALAGRLGAYVMANDSDYVVLNCEGYKVRRRPFVYLIFGSKVLGIYTARRYGLGCECKRLRCAV